MLSPEQLSALDDVSAGEPRMLYSLFTPAWRRSVVFGGSAVVGALEVGRR
jgi:hypothetical protein